MSLIQQRLQEVQLRIARAERAFGRDPGSVQLLAVSKTRPASDIAEAFRCGQGDFGENYLREAIEKMDSLAGLPLTWHFIGGIQSNKTRVIAERFDWVHSLSDLRHARRLDQQRPEGLAPLKVCIQVNVSGELSKGGVVPGALDTLLPAVASLKRLELRGLMAIPAPTNDMEAQRRPFALLRSLRNRFASTELPLPSLSMGMSDDLEAAIAEGATLVRIGTAVFGPRI